MPHYFIDAQFGGFLHHDDEGHDLPDDEAARKTALAALPGMARDAMPAGDTDTFTVTVRGEDGVIVYAASLTLEGRWGPGAAPRSVGVQAASVPPL